MKKNVQRSATPDSRKQPGGSPSGRPVNRKNAMLLLGVLTVAIAIGAVVLFRWKDSEPAGPYIRRPAGTLTFAKDIAPIVFSHCAVCHRPGGRDVYRNFVIPIPTTSTRYVRAVEFLPDNPKIVHHAFMKVDRTRESRRLDERDAEPGFDFMITPVSAQMPEGHFLSWVPGNVLSPEPNGLAWTLHQDTDLVLQLHLRPAGKPETLQPA